MEEMLHQLWCNRPWINNVINYRTYQLVHDLFHQQYGWYTGTQAMLISMCRAPKQLRKDKNGFLPTWVALHVHGSNGLSGRGEKCSNVVALYGIEMVHMCRPPIMDGSLACYLPQEQVHWSRLTQLRTKNTPTRIRPSTFTNKLNKKWFTLEQDIYSWPVIRFGIDLGPRHFLYTAVVPRSKTQLWSQNPTDKPSASSNKNEHAQDPTKIYTQENIQQKWNMLFWKKKLVFLSNHSRKPLYNLIENKK